MEIQATGAQGTAEQGIPEPQRVELGFPSSSGTAPADHHQPLTNAVARLLGSGGPGDPAVKISYKITKNPDEIVTVFTDTNTGQVVAQFPSDVMIQIAQFFDKETGVTLDHNA
jgi:hypothetical protein